MRQKTRSRVALDLVRPIAQAAGILRGIVDTIEANQGQVPELLDRVIRRLDARWFEALDVAGQLIGPEFQPIKKISHAKTPPTSQGFEFWKGRK